MLRRVGLVRTEVSEEDSTSIIRVIRIGELGTTLAVSSSRRPPTLFLVQRFLSPWWRKRCVPPKRRFLQEPHGVTSRRRNSSEWSLLWDSAVLPYSSQLLMSCPLFPCWIFALLLIPSCVYNCFRKAINFMGSPVSACRKQFIHWVPGACGKHDPASLARPLPCWWHVPPLTFSSN
jgi:hypothetical protein